MPCRRSSRSPGWILGSGSSTSPRGCRLSFVDRSRFEQPGVVASDEFEPSIVQIVVVRGAQQDEVVDVGAATVLPPHEVVGFAAGRVGAADDAAFVAFDQRDPLLRGRLSAGASEPQRRAVVGE